MDSQIQQELILLLNIDNVEAKEQIKILAMCSNILSSNNYISELVKVLENLFNQQDFDIFSEFSRLVLSIFNLNKNVRYRKEITESRIKYMVYACLYYYMLKFKSSWLNQQDIGKIRILFCNSWDLVSLIPETIKISKEGCFNCLTKISWFGIKNNNISV